MLFIEHAAVGQLACTCTILADRTTNEAVIIDAGAEAERLHARVTALGFKVRHLLHTHAHIDHVGATHELRLRCDARSAIHGDDIPLAEALDQQAALLGLPSIPPPVFDDLLVDGDEIRFGSLKLTALHTPGHTHGSTSFAVEQRDRHVILTGDTLFAGGVGRWDLGGSSLADIVQSIRKQLLCYPDDTIVIPGHGPHTTIGQERRSNPYLT